MFFVKTGKGKEINTNKTFNPEKYGMTFCPNCKGKGKLPKNPDGFIVCSKCGGSGVIRKEEKVPEVVERK